MRVIRSMSIESSRPRVPYSCRVFLFRSLHPFPEGTVRSSDPKKDVHRWEGRSCLSLSMSTEGIDPSEILSLTFVHRVSSSVGMLWGIESFKEWFFFSRKDRRELFNLLDQYHLRVRTYLRLSPLLSSAEVYPTYENRIGLKGVKGQRSVNRTK